MTKAASVALVFVSSLYCPVGNAAPQIGSSNEGGIFLYRDSAEGYWTDWRAYPMMPRDRIPTDGQAELAIKGEGKLADFNGTLSINCENGKNHWKGAENFYSALTQDSEIREVVPKEAVNNAIRLFCKQ